MNRQKFVWRMFHGFGMSPVQRVILGVLAVVAAGVVESVSGPQWLDLPLIFLLVSCLPTTRELVDRGS